MQEQKPNEMNLFVKILVYVFSFLCVCLVSCEKQKQEHNFKQAEININTANLKEGDILLKRSRGIISDMVVKHLNEKIPISHCAVVVKNHQQQLELIHSISKEYAPKDGVQSIRIEDFLADAHPSNIYVVRRKNSLEKRREFVEKIKSYEQQQIAFDYAFDYEHKDKMFCSEIIYHAFNETNDSIYNDIKNHIKVSFQVFFDTTKFEKVPIR